MEDPTFKERSLPGSGAKVRAIATSLHHPEIAYVSYSELVLDGKSWMGVAKTSNAGRDWQLVWKESSEAAATMFMTIGLLRGSALPGERIRSTSRLPIRMQSELMPLILAARCGPRMAARLGAAVYSRNVNGKGWTTVGLDVTTTYGVHFDPFDAKRMFITYTDIGAVSQRRRRSLMDQCNHGCT